MGPNVPDHIPRKMFAMVLQADEFGAFDQVGRTFKPFTAADFAAKWGEPLQPFVKRDLEAFEAYIEENPERAVDEMRVLMSTLYFSSN